MPILISIFFPRSVFQTELFLIDLPFSMINSKDSILDFEFELYLK